MALRVEFTIEPFVAGEPGSHVLAAVEAANGQGLTVEMGPFGTTAEGEDDIVLAGTDAAMRAAVTAGATRVSVQLTRS